MKNLFSTAVSQFVVVVLSIFFVVLIVKWWEKRTVEKRMTLILSDLVDDVRKDSVRIIEAIHALDEQHDSLRALLKNLDAMDYEKANRNIHFTYFSYDAFDPTAVAFESLVFEKDLDLVSDTVRLHAMKGLDFANGKLGVLHANYYRAVELFRNDFICQHNISYFNFENIPPEKGIEVWNRLNSLSLSVEYYYEGLILAKRRYNAFLNAFQ